MDQFMELIPAIGDPTASFIETLGYRNLEEVYEENLLNEMATGYFRDLVLNDGEDETTINRYISWERHRTLNWLRQPEEAQSWDDTDTST